MLLAPMKAKTIFFKSYSLGEIKQELGEKFSKGVFGVIFFLSMKKISFCSFRKSQSPEIFRRIAPVYGSVLKFLKKMWRKNAKKWNLKSETVAYLYAIL